MKTIFILILVALSFQARGEIDDLAVRLEEHYKTLSAWQTDFTQTTFVEVLGQTMDKTGTLTVMRPDKIRIAYHHPQKVYVSDGKKMWIYKDEFSAWQFDRPQKILSKEALSFLSGLHNLSQIFVINHNPRESEPGFTIKGTGLQRLLLTPKDKHSTVLSIELGIDTKNLAVKEAILSNTSGNVTHYQFHQLIVDPKLDPQLFSVPNLSKRKIIKK